MMPFYRILFSFCLMTAAVGPPGLEAHEDPRVQAEDLGEEMARTGPQVALLLKRARLWQTLREFDLALAELERAQALEPGSVVVKEALARIYYTTGALEAAYAAIEEALPLAESASTWASLLMLRASIHLDWKAPEKAAVDCSLAIGVCPGHGRIEWYLRRAQAQRLSGRLDACRQGLEEAWRMTGSAVLHAQWVDALIDAEEWERAQGVVDEQMPGLRFAAAWQIRQARIALGHGREEEARRILEDALEELNARLRPEASYPDIMLLADRGLAHLLLGDVEAARADYERAKESGATGWMHWRLSRHFEEEGAP